MARQVTTTLVALATVLLAPLGAAAQTPLDDRAARRSPVVEVFERSRNAVVSISSTEIVKLRSRSPFDSLFDELFDLPQRPRTRKRHSVGSGFVIHHEGYIVTNAHVVARTTEQKVSFADGRSYDAVVVSADPSRDLAVLKIDTDETLPTLPLGRSDDLMVGETVIAIGNPFGFQHTVTAGVVSAVDREIEVARDVVFRGLVQTDASINPGNSGGPLLNVLGELIGVNCAIRGDAQNIGFAIPVDQLLALLPELLDVERRYRIDTGLKVDSLAEPPRVRAVRADSPADDARILPGDVLVSIDGLPVREGIDFDIALINRRPNDAVDLTLERDGRRVETTLFPARRPIADGERLAADRLGVDVYPVPRDVARQLGLTRSTGLLVTEVEPGSPAAEAGLMRRDVLLAIGRYYISSVDDLGQVLEEIGAGEIVDVLILRVDVERQKKSKRSGPIRVR
jgi:serine protease Do